MAFMASRPSQLLASKEVAEKTAIALPTVSKLLKKLVKNKLLISERGSEGGYLLNCVPEEISIADLITALEGPIAITQCNLGHQHCRSAPSCKVKTPWLRINQTIHSTLQSIKLADLYQSTEYSEKTG